MLHVQQDSRVEYVKSGQVICEDPAVLSIPSDFNVEQPDFNYTGSPDLERDVEILLDYIDRLETVLKSTSKDYRCRRL